MLWPSVKWKLIILISAHEIKMIPYMKRAKWRHTLQITPCHIRVPWPYMAGFSSQKCWSTSDTISMRTWTVVLTYSVLGDPHSHCFQWFTRLGGPRGKHPWLTKENYFQSPGTRITVAQWVKLVTIRIFQPTQNFCTILKTCPLLYILSPKLTACVIWQ